MKYIWLRLIVLVGIMSLLTACGESSALDTSRDMLSVDTQTIKVDNSSSEEMQSEVNSTESNDKEESIITTPQEKYDIAKALMKHGDLSAALETFNEISQDMDVSEEVKICSEYAPYVGFWKAEEYDNGYEVASNYLIYVRIPIDIDAEEKKLDIAQVAYCGVNENNMLFSYYDELHEMTLDGLVASKTYEPGYKKVSTFNLSTGVYHHDYWSAGSEKNVPADGLFVKEDDSVYISTSHFFYPDTVIATIDSVIDGVQYAGESSEDDTKIYYYYLSSHNEDDHLAVKRLEDYKVYLSMNNELYDDTNEILVKDDVFKCEVTMTILQDESGRFAKDDYLLCVSVSEEKNNVEKIDPAIGMTAEEVIMSTWGEPEKNNVTETSGHKHEQWVYSGGRYIYFEDGIVTAIQWSE